MAERRPEPATTVQEETVATAEAEPDVAPELPPAVMRWSQVVVRMEGESRFADIEVTRDGLTLDGEKKAIASAWITDTYRSTELVLNMADGSAMAIELGQDEARRALDLLGLSASEKAIRFELGASRAKTYGVAAFFAGLLTFSTVCMATSTSVVLAFVMTMGGSSLLALLASRSVTRPSIAVGADGISLQIDGNTRFFPYDQLLDVRIEKSGIEIEPREGDVVYLKLFVSREERTSLQERIASARAAHAPQKGAEAVVETFERGGRTVEAWRRAVVAALEGGTLSFRSRPVLLEEVMALVRDGDAPLEIRVGAALALASRGARGRDEVIAVATATADERLRAAFLQIADGTLDDARLDALLA